MERMYSCMLRASITASSCAHLGDWSGISWSGMAYKSSENAVWTRFILWPGKPSEEDLTLIRTRKPEAPVIEVTLEDGTKRKLWCTFGTQQIDLDPFSPSGKATPCPITHIPYRCRTSLEPPDIHLKLWTMIGSSCSCCVFFSSAQFWWSDQLLIQLRGMWFPALLMIVVFRLLRI